MHSDPTGVENAVSAGPGSQPAVRANLDVSMAPYLAALGSALLMWAAFPPVGWGLLAFVAPAPLIWAVRRVERPGTALVLGFAHGLVFFGPMLNWVLTIGAVAWIPLTLWLAMTSAVMTFAIWLFRMWPATRFFLISVGIWGIWELARASIPFGGFPWGLLGYAAASPPGFVGSVQWIGPGGWSVLAASVAIGVVLVVEDTSNWRLLVDATVVVLLLALGGGLFPPQPDGDTIRVAIVQGSSRARPPGVTTRTRGSSRCTSPSPSKYQTPRSTW